MNDPMTDEGSMLSFGSPTIHNAAKGSRVPEIYYDA